jgi:glycosyltransferase involved in cell wall biosynthesis
MNYTHKNELDISVIMPALNEEQSILGAINSTLSALREFNINWEIIVVNDGSTDKTPEIVSGILNKENRIRMISHSVPQGIGASFRDGVAAADKNAVVLITTDGENDPRELVKYFHLLDKFDMIVPYVINKDVRSRTRQILSKLFFWIIKFSFGTNFCYTNGNVIYRKKVFDKITQRSRGFFYTTECLIKAERAGFTFTEVPVQINARQGGRTKSLSWGSFKMIVKEYIKLFFSVNILRKYD